MSHEGEPGRGRDHELAVGQLPRRRERSHGHPRQDLVLEARSAPNTIPHVAKATGIYLNSMLAVHEAQNARLRRGDPAHRRRATSPTARARTSSSSRTARSARRRSRRRSCPGSRATASSRSRRTSATWSRRRTLIRSDLYLADEVFMTRHRRRGDAGPRRSTTTRSASGRSRSSCRRRTSTPCAAESTAGRTGSTASPSRTTPAEA